MEREKTERTCVLCGRLLGDRLFRGKYPVCLFCVQAWCLKKTLSVQLCKKLEELDFSVGSAYIKL